MKTISFRLTLWYALAAGCTALLILLFGRYLLESHYIAGIDDLNDKEFEEIGPRIAELPLEELSRTAREEAVVQAIVRHTEIDASLFFFEVGYPRQEPFFISGNLSGHSLPLGDWSEERRTVNDDDELGPLRIATYLEGDYAITIASSLLGWKSLDHNLLYLSSIILVVVFVASLAVGFGMSQVALRPIANIQRIAQRIDAENLSERIPPPSSNDEVARLTHFLNRMFDRLESSFEQVRRFASDASHELKTPLSLVRLRAEELLKPQSGLPDAALDEVSAQLGDIERLGKVIDDLLLLSKSEAGALALNLQSASVGAFLEDFAIDAKALAEDRGIHFELSRDTLTNVAFDRVWLRHCLFNLLSNALKFSPESSTVRLASVAYENSWLLRFEDAGPGVAPEKLARIFERFFSESHERGEKGSGLGLAICRSIVHQHHGTIEAFNRAGESGLSVEIRLPLEWGS